MAALVAKVFGILNAPFAAAKSKAVPPQDNDYSGLAAPPNTSSSGGGPLGRALNRARAPGVRDHKGEMSSGRSVTIGHLEK